jgi:polysaccharide deacetylase family protein (PEP-CTERM system associated)
VNAVTVPGPRPAGPVNVMSVDVEEHFHVAAFAGQVRREDWTSLPSRVERNTDRMLALFADRGVAATFFILGWVAERCPALVRRIAAQGHEVASHGYCHVPAFQQDRAAFADDVRRSKGLLEDAAGQTVLGYRAASFSIVKRNQWAFEELDRAGYRYSSSVNPVRHDIYGFPDAPRFNFTPAGTSITECPVTTLEVGGNRIPCGGGGYFRLLPYPVFRWALRRVNAAGHSCYFYIHPWEVDPDQPRVAGAPLKSRFRHYTNLHRTEPRLRQLLDEFAWTRFDRLLGLA